MNKTCDHRWDMYIGFTDQFEHCVSCGMKKKDYKQPTEAVVAPAGKPWRVDGGAVGGLITSRIKAFIDAEYLVLSRKIDHLELASNLWEELIAVSVAYCNNVGTLCVDFGTVYGSVCLEENAMSARNWVIYHELPNKQGKKLFACL